MDVVQQIEIDSVESPALKIKGVIIRGTTRYASLCDLGPLPARASFPIEMIRVHAKSRPRLVMKPRQVALSTADSNTTLFDLPTFIDAMEEMKMTMRITKKTVAMKMMIHQMLGIMIMTMHSLMKLH